MINCFTLLFCLTLTISTQAQLLIPDIPEKLKTDAHEVTIADKTSFTIKNEKDSELERHYKIAILNKHAWFGKTLSLYYDSFRKVIYAKVIVYDYKGKKVRTYSLKDFEDWQNSNSDVANDSRAKYLDITELDYPYYVEVHYKMAFKGSLHYPKWTPVEGDRHSVLKASMTVVAPDVASFRHNSVNIDEPEIRKSEDSYVYTWSLSDFSAYEYESFSYRFEDYAPIVNLAPNSFEMQGYKGKMNSWSEIGQWQEQLNKDRNDLALEDLSDLNRIVGQQADGRSKIQSIYEYLQEQTRYVSIQLGIGGWQPFRSSFVHENKYGDCKALSYYTQSLLELFGFDAYYTLIRAGANASPILTNFPSRQFNHVILTVPIQEDTVWLECTSQDDPFGYMGTFTSDRNALLVDGANSKVIRTHAYSHDDNLTSTNVNLTLDQFGNSTGSVRRRYHCLQLSDDGFEWILKKSPKEQEHWLYDELEWGTFAINDFKVYPLINSLKPWSGFDLSLSSLKIGKSSGNRVFVEPFIFSDIQELYVPDIERKTPIDIRYPYTLRDTITIDIPNSLNPERMISNNLIDSEFGSYKCEYLQKDGTFIFIRSFILHKGRYPKEAYTDFRNFIMSAQRSDRQKLVLIK
ncbi:MAG: DUF3857 domain-containing protein [Bacteroidetes bacterium]|nr:DUF3857 domain-containing protein [Bacteroidota bacterium]